MARYGRDYWAGRQTGSRGPWDETESRRGGPRGREPGWTETLRQGWGFGAGASEGYGRDYRRYDDPYRRINRGGRSRFGGGYGGAERGEGWRGPYRGYDYGW